MSKRILLTGAAISVMAYMGAGTVAANAACVEAGNVWTCTGVDGVGVVDTSDPSVTINIGTGALVDTTAGAIVITPGVDADNNGAVTITNDGSIVPGLGGVIVADAVNTIGGVSIRITGISDDADNDVTIVNNGTIEGDIILDSIGGAIAVTNTGSATSTALVDIALAGAGNIAFNNAGTLVDSTVSLDAGGTAALTNTGDLTTTGSVTADGEAGASVDNAGTLDVGSNLNAFSFRTTNTVVGTVTTTTNDGGSTALTNTGTLVVDSDVNVEGNGDATLANSGDLTIGDDLDVISSGSTTVSDPGVSSSSTSSGGMATLTNDAGATLTVVDTADVTGNAGASVTNAGTLSIGDDLDIRSAGTATTNDAVTNETSSTRNGGEATLLNDGTLNADVFLSGDAGASAVNNGTIAGHLSVSSQGGNSTDSNAIGITFDNGSGNVTETARVRTSTAVGGTGTVTNTSALTIEGDVSINAIGGATLNNTGRIIGRADLDSVGNEDSFSDTNSFTTDVVGGVTTDVDTFTSDDSFTTNGGQATTAIGPDGTLGTLNFVFGDFTVLDQSGFAGSDVTVDGSVFGGINSRSNQTDSTSFFERVTTTVTTPQPAPDPDIIVVTQVNTSRSSSTAVGGESTVTINGSVSDSNGFGFNGDVTSNGVAGSTVTVNVNGFVDDSVSSTSSRTNSTSETVSTFVDGTFTGSTSHSTSTAVGGASTVAIAGRVDGFVSSNSFGDSSVLVDGSTGSSVTANSGGFDSTDDSVRTVVDDGAGTITDTIVDNETDTASVNGGNSLVIVNGTTGSNANAYSANGNVTVRVGTSAVADPSKSIFDPDPFVPTVGNDVNVDAVDSSSTFDRTRVSINGGGFVTTSQASTNTYGGGNALVEVYGRVADDIFADGFESGSVSVWGSVDDDLNVNSAFANSTSTFNFDDQSNGSTTNTNSTTWTGGTASTTVFSGATVGDDVRVTGYMGATATINGTVSGDVRVDSLFTNSNSSNVDFNTADPIRRVDTDTVTSSLAGNTATLWNTGDIMGRAYLEGNDVQVTNDHLIVGGLTIGYSDVFLAGFEGTTVSETTVTSGPASISFTPTATPMALTSTTNQNGLLDGGIDINGSGSVNTVNLNNGSFTFGLISAQMTVNELGREVDDTVSTLNLNGAGNFGGSYVGAAFGGGFFSGAGDVMGFAAINKNDSGTFNIMESDLLDADVTTINGGRLEISSTGFENNYFSNFFGTVIDGDLVNNSELVAGYVNPVAGLQFLDNLTRQANFTINANDLWVEGNFTQSATGTSFFGFAPSLARPDDVTGFTAVNEPLGTPVFLLSRQAFGFSGVSTSVIGVEGDTTLAGTVHVYTPEGVYQNGDSALIFSTTGTVTNTATATMSRSSMFVSLGFNEVVEGGKNNTYIVVSRSSYGTAGANENQIAIGTALDGALDNAVDRVSTDLLGGNGFGSVLGFSQAQDILNFTTALDFDLSEASEVQQVFGELDGQFQATISSLNLNKGFMNAMNTHTRSGKGSMGVWASVNANLDSIDGDDNGISGVDANSTGYAAGFSGMVGDNFTVGFGLGKTTTNVDAETRPEQADIDMTQVGLFTNWLINTANSDVIFSVDLLGAYSWGDVMTERALPTFGRVAYANYNANEIRGNLQINAEFNMGNTGDFTIEPYIGVDVRRMKRDAFVEDHSALNVSAMTVSGLSLNFDEYSETSVDPYIGARVNWNDLQLSEESVMKPYFGLRYTHVSADALTTAQFAGGGNSFDVKGADVNGYVTVSVGSTFLFSERFGAYLGYNGSFGGDLSGHNMTGGFRVNF